MPPPITPNAIKERRPIILPSYISSIPLISSRFAPPVFGINKTNCKIVHKAPKPMPNRISFLRFTN